MLHTWALQKQKFVFKNIRNICKFVKHIYPISCAFISEEISIKPSSNSTQSTIFFTITAIIQTSYKHHTRLDFLNTCTCSILHKHTKETLTTKWSVAPFLKGLSSDSKSLSGISGDSALLPHIVSFTSAVQPCLSSLPVTVHRFHTPARKIKREEWKYIFSWLFFCEFNYFQ